MYSVVECAIPLVAAPMAGGPSTPALVAAAAEAGGLGFLGGGYLTRASLGDQLHETRALSASPFGVNLFVPREHPSALPGLESYRRELLSEAERYGIELPQPDPADTDHYADKLELLCEQPVAVVSFTFGLPDREAVLALHDADTSVAITVTSLHEARSAVERGADALVVQGAEAGGHRGTHDASASPDATPLAELVRAVRASTALPIVAAGGVSTRQGVAELLAAGATVVAVGTALLRSPECGASQTYKDALVSGEFTETRVTRAFSGRLARALVNRFVAEHDATAPTAYPELNQLTRPIRAAAARAGDAGGLALWAGTAYSSARADGAAEILRALSPHGDS
ncbi:nitronate monooxygenase [Parafrigoribacterium soli]|uniref:nitronate monooxygenase n=1 Tax=Parafrigoribacterium soli TaxID=3144663 RepID=UPI0032ECF4DB